MPVMPMSNRTPIRATLDHGAAHSERHTDKQTAAYTPPHPRIVTTTPHPDQKRKVGFVTLVHAPREREQRKRTRAKYHRGGRRRRAALVITLRLVGDTFCCCPTFLLGLGSGSGSAPSAPSMEIAVARSLSRRTRRACIAAHV